MNLSGDSRLTELAQVNEAAVRDVLQKFGVIHCAHCTVPDQTVAELCNERKLPHQVVLNALVAGLSA
jgi:hypothetical protein